jgi:acetyl esterase/lipase
MGHPMGTPFPYQFCKATHKRVLCTCTYSHVFCVSFFLFLTNTSSTAINYRKCLTAETAFPAPLQDALAGYLYLLGLGFEPQNITLIGDSSGAHILLGLTRYLAELHMEHMQDPEVGLGLGLGLEPGASHTQDDTTTTTTKLEHRSGGSGGSNGDHSVVRNLGVPGALLLISPSTNLSHPPNDTIPTCILSPYLNRRVYPSMARHYPPDALERNPYFSPASPAVTGESAALVYAQQHPQQRSQERRSRGCVEALEVGRGTGVDSVRMDVDIEKDGAGGDGFTSHNTDTNMNTNTRTGLRIYIQHGTAELITPDQDLFTAKLAQEGVVFEVDRVEGGCHLDAMMAFTCLEKKESSWVRLLDAVKKYTDDG